MSLLIINTLPENDEEAIEAIKKLSAVTDKVKVVNTYEMNIMHCTGCRVCMFQTPGRCCLKDDYSEIAGLFFEYINIIIISDVSLNFLSYEAMRLLERRFPFAVILSEFRENQIRHILRYNKKSNIGILYKGQIESNILNDWLLLYAKFIEDASLGAFPINDIEELCKCIL